MSSKKPSAKAPRSKAPQRPAPKPKSKQVLASTVSLLPAAREQKLKSAMNVMARSDLSYIRVKGCEPIRTVAATVAFSLGLDEYINPLNPVLFPKLSQEASLYDKWRPRLLRLRYAPRCPTNRSGQVGGLFLPDSHPSEAPASMIEIDRYEHSFTAAPWTAAECKYEGSRDAQMWYYTAPPAEFTGATLGTVRTQSCGVVQVATSDSASADAGGLLGTVYLEYDIEFCERRPPYTSAFSVDAPTANIVGTGAPVYSAMNIAVQAASTVPFGFPGMFTNTDASQLIAAVSGATPSYLPSLGAVGALAASYFMKLHKGTTRIHSRTQFGTPTTPLVQSQQTHQSVIQGGVSPRELPPPPKLVRQVCGVYDSKESDPVAYPYIEVRKDGSAWGSNDKIDWFPLPGPEARRGPLGANNDVQASWVLYDPVTNTTTYPYNPSIANGTVAYVYQNFADITVNTDYACYLAFAALVQVASGSSRTVTVTATALNTDST